MLTTILDQIPPALLVVFRLGGLMIYGPVFGARVIPGQVKVFLAFLLGLAVFPLIDTAHLVDPSFELDVWVLAPVVAMELLIGVVIGFLASLPLVVVQIGGLVMGQQMGLGLARFFNPAINDNADVLGQVLFMMTLAGFLLVGGHEAMVLAVLNSFQHIPLGGFVPDLGLLAMLTALLTAAFELALRVAAPLLALIFLQTVAVGFVAKTVPQLNILSLGFPLRILGGLLIVSLGLVVIDEVMMEGIDETLNVIFEWIESHGRGTR
ncbi:MAG: flagellar biosynthetic protein FliR [Planctomycetota bacterium]|jgi:flagellar biosynthetic protein FliR